MSLRIIEWQGLINGSAAAEESAITVGVFDGVHRGHQELIKSIVRRGPNPTVVTFRENPKKYISRLAGTANSYEGDIFSLKQKLAVFEQMGVGRVILIDFSENFSKLKGWEFFDILQKRARMVFLSIGSNFRCGYRQDTGAESIREINEQKGIPTEVIAPLKAGKTQVSSSRIRKAIASGDLVQAAALMGRNVELDMSDITGGDAGCDLNAVQRIVPANGSYPVVMYPGRISGQALVENGKVYLPGRAERLEFL